jgi:hypothetical protein
MVTTVPKNSSHAIEGICRAAAPRYTNPDTARIGAKSLPLSLPLSMPSATKAAKAMPANVGHHCSELGHTRAA